MQGTRRQGGLAQCNFCSFRKFKGQYSAVFMQRKSHYKIQPNISFLSILKINFKLLK